MTRSSNKKASAKASEVSPAPPEMSARGSDQVETTGEDRAEYVPMLVPYCSASEADYGPPPHAVDLDLPPNVDFLKAIRAVPTFTNDVKEGEPLICFVGFGGKDGYWDTVCVVNPEGRLKLREHPDYENALGPTADNYNCSTVEIVLILGRGLGLVARRDFKPGEVILFERPLLIMPAVAPALFANNMDNIINLLHPTLKQAFYELYNCKERGPHKIDSMSIVRTNAVAADFPFDKETQYLAVCNLISRANHDCTGNADVFFDTAKLVMCLKSTMPITAGTEITFSYVPTLQSARDRNSELKQKWGFKCTCPACDRSSPNFSAGERSRMILKTFFAQTDEMKLMMNPTWTGYDDAYINFVLNLIDKERLYWMRPKAMLKFTESAYAAYLRSKTKELSTRTDQLLKRTRDEMIKYGQNSPSREEHLRTIQIQISLRFPEVVIPFDDIRMGKVPDFNNIHLWLATQIAGQRVAHALAKRKAQGVAENRDDAGVPSETSRVPQSYSLDDVHALLENSPEEVLNEVSLKKRVAAEDIESEGLSEMSHRQGEAVRSVLKEQDQENRAEVENT